MADDTLPVQSGILDPLVGMGFFSPNMSLEEIKRRRAIGAALASRARPFPKTVGEGLTALGEAFGERREADRLAEAEKGYLAKRDADMPGAVPPVAPVPRPVAEAPLEVMPPVVAAAPALAPAVARPSPLPPAPAGPMAGAPGVGTRADITRALAMRNPAMADMVAQIGGQEAPPPSPMVTANASLASPGAAPASPVPGGASFAEEGPNPVTVSRDIKPMLVADATGARPGGIGKVPGVFDPRAPGPAATGESAPSARPEPQLAPPGKREQDLMNYAQKYSNDPDVIKKVAPEIGLLKEQREKDWTIKHEKWKIDYANDLKQNDPKYQQDLINARTQQARETEEYTTFPFGKARHEQMAKESAELVKGVPAGQAAIANVRGLMNSDAGMFTGSDANVSLGLVKLGRAIGVDFAPKTLSKAENTEAFKGFITPILAALRPAVVGTGAQTAPELKLLQEAAAGNITLERGSIEKILSAVEHLNAVAAVQHHKRLISAAGGNENARSVLFGQYELPLEEIIPRGKADLLRREIESKRGDTAAIKAEMEEFDKTYFTPGLAQRVLSRR